MCSMMGAVAVVKLRQWRGVKPVSGPTGVATTTRFRTTPKDERVLDLVGDHMGRLRRSDLVAVVRPEPLVPTENATAKRQERRDRLNTRKTALTAKSSARWANAIIAANDAQYRSARDAQHRHIIGLRAAIATIENRLAQPTADTLSIEQCRVRRKAKLPRGYATQAERFQKQRRLQILRARLHRVQADFDDRIVPCRRGRQTTGRHAPSPRHGQPDRFHMAREVGMRPRPHRNPRLRRRAVRELDDHGHPGGRTQPAAAKTVGAPRQRQARPLRAFRPGGVSLPRR